MEKLASNWSTKMEILGKLGNQFLENTFHSDVVFRLKFHSFVMIFKLGVPPNHLLKKSNCLRGKRLDFRARFGVGLSAVALFLKKQKVSLALRS